MCLTAAVGRHAPNHHDDVKTIQILLNLNFRYLKPLSQVQEDGSSGPATIKAIEAFQSMFLKVKEPTGRVDPNSETLEAMRVGEFPASRSCRSTTFLFSPQILKGIYIHASDSLINRYFTHLTALMNASGITTPLRRAHFLAQVGHESAELRYCEELASGDAYEHRKDLGNTQPGDGKRFKGRGLIQLTGRANYQRYGTDRGLDFTKEPTAIASNPRYAVDVACWFWSKHRLNGPADGDNILAITRAINGGTNGLQNRIALLTRAKFFLA